jgi:uncharacterized CHY-type Zn-finger protein
VKVIPIKGRPVDEQTRCVHYQSPQDIIAIKFPCCQAYFPCYDCHIETVAHDPQVWKKEEFDTHAILCGACKTELTINQYLTSNDQCPHCNAPFNPGCKTHYHLYFDL